MASTIVWPDELVTKGKEAKARVEQGDKSLEKAENLYRSAGVILLEAKEIVKQTKGATWPGFLFHHCDIGRSRADDYIRIAKGETTLEELREGIRKRQETYHEKKARRYNGKSSEKPQQKQEPVQTDNEEPPWDNPVEEAREVLDERTKLLAEIIEQLKTYTLEQLEHAKVALSHV